MYIRQQGYKDVPIYCKMPEVSVYYIIVAAMKVRIVTVVGKLLLSYLSNKMDSSSLQ